MSTERRRKRPSPITLGVSVERAVPAVLERAKDPAVLDAGSRANRTKWLALRLCFTTRTEDLC